MKRERLIRLCKTSVSILIAVAVIICVLLLFRHEHNFSNWEISEVPTCDSIGIRIRRCSCGTEEYESISAKGHELVAIGIVNSTCTENGRIDFRCVTCSAISTEETPSLDHEIEDATCISENKCKRCNYTFGESLGHTVKFGLCERCNNVVQPEISLPDLPISTFVKITGYKTEMKITELSYKFTLNTITFTYSGTKIADEGTLTDGLYFCGFSYRLYDSDGILVTSGKTSVYDLKTGESFKNEKFFITSLPEISESYTLVIEDYTASGN